MKNIKLSDLLNSMTSAINNEMANKRIDDMGQMHNDFKRIVSPILSKHELVIPYCWGVRLVGHYDDIIKYDIDFIDDKRYKFERRGKLVGIKFKPIIEMPEESTLQDLITAIDKKNTIENIERLEKMVAEQKKELKENEDGLSELKEKLKTFA